MASSVADATTVELPSADVVKKQAAGMSTLKSSMDEVRGEMGQLVKDGEETHGIHRGAMKQAFKLSRMESGSRAEYLRHFDHYRAALALDDQQSLLDG